MSFSLTEIMLVAAAIDGVLGQLKKPIDLTNELESASDLQLLWQNVRTLKPFNTVEDKFWMNPEGGYSHDLTSYELGALIVRLLQPNGDVPRAMAEFARLVAENRDNVWVVTEIRGLKIGKPIMLPDACSIVPNDLLPNDKHKRRFIRIPAPGIVLPSDAAAIVQKVNVDPIMIAAGDKDRIAKVSKANGELSDLRRQTRKAIRGAILLTGNAPAELGWTYVTTEGPSLFSSSMMQGENTELHSIFGHSIDEDAFRASFDLVSRVPGSQSLSVAFHRLGNSRISRSRDDAAIDLGIAMEALLMHGEQDAKSEINYKLGLRAGWLVGKTPEERRAAKKRAGTLDSARSAAAHGGHVPTSFDQDDSDLLVRQLIRAILERGKFPDWTNLCFGG